MPFKHCYWTCKASKFCCSFVSSFSEKQNSEEWIPWKSEDWDTCPLLLYVCLFYSGTKRQPSENSSIPAVAWNLVNFLLVPGIVPDVNCSDGGMHSWVSELAFFQKKQDSAACCLSRFVCVFAYPMYLNKALMRRKTSRCLVTSSSSWHKKQVSKVWGTKEFKKHTLIMPTCQSPDLHGLSNVLVASNSWKLLADL